MGNAERPAALELIQKQIPGGRARLARRVQFGLEELGLDETDVWEAIQSASADSICKCEPDRDRSERTIVVLKLSVDDRPIYCKVSVNLEVNHDPMVLSFKPWS